jgi:hypothetical protein
VERRDAERHAIGIFVAPRQAAGKLAPEMEETLRRLSVRYRVIREGVAVGKISCAQKGPLLLTLTAEASRCKQAARDTKVGRNFSRKLRVNRYFLVTEECPAEFNEAAPWVWTERD